MEIASSWQPRMTRAGLIALAAILVIFLYLTFLAGRFKGITSIVAMDYAQLARNIAQGEGYSTKFIRPLSLARVPQIQGHPEFSSAPVFPYIASVFMRIMPDKERALALACGLGLLLTVPVVFFLGWQLFDTRTGILGAALFATNIAFLRYSIAGYEVTWLTLWVTILFLVCYTLSRKARWRLPLAAAAGGLMGLTYLTEYLWGALILPVAVYIYLSSDRTRRMHALGVFLAAFVVICLPWWIRNMRLTGNPFFCLRAAETIMATRSNPGNTLYRSFTTDYPSLFTYAIDRPIEVLEKLRDGAGVLYTTLLRVCGPYATPFFLVAILVTLGSATFERLRYLWYASFVIVWLALICTAPADRLLAPFGPVAGVIAAGFYFRLLETKVGDLTPRLRQRYLTIAIAALMAIHMLPLTFNLFAGATAEEQETARMAMAAREVASLTDGPVVTDVPWLIAWYADRPAIWLPKTRADLQNIQDRLGKIPWLLLTPQVANENYDLAERTLKEWGPAWKEGMRGNYDFAGYTVYKHIAQGNWVLFRANPNAKQDLPPEIMQQYQEQGQQQPSSPTEPSAQQPAPTTPTPSAGTP